MLQIDLDTCHFSITMCNEEINMLSIFRHCNSKTFVLYAYLLTFMNGKNNLFYKQSVEVEIWYSFSHHLDSAKFMHFLLNLNHKLSMEGGDCPNYREFQKALE